MEPKEVMRLFVVRPPEPAAIVHADRLGPSIVMNKLSGLLEREKPEALLAQLQELRKDTKLSDTSLFLQLAEKDTGLKAMMADVEATLARVEGRSNARGKQGNENAKKPSSGAEDETSESTKADEKALDKISPDKLRAELIQLRDRWVLDRVMESRFVTDLKRKAGVGPQETGKKNDDEEEKAKHDKNAADKKSLHRNKLERALKIGTAVLLGIEQPTIKNQRLESLLTNPVVPSMRLARALLLRQTSERHTKLLPARQDKVSPLVARRENLRTLRRVAMEVLDDLSKPEDGSTKESTLPHPLSTLLPKWFVRPRGLGISPARKPVASEQFVKKVIERLDENGKKEFKALSKVVNLESHLRIPSFFGLVEEEICGVTVQMAVGLPGRTTYAVRALTAAYALPQVPVQPVGFIELMRVTEELVDYSAREIAHIENKSGGETRERLHTYTETNQNIISSEQFEETEETRDLQTTQRNELASTSSQVAEQEFTVNAGLNVSATYGVGVGSSVQLDASLAVGYRSAVTTSQQTASTVSREVIAKTVSRIRQNQRRSQTATILRTTEERNRHEFTVANSRTDTYLWVEKIMELKLKAYGKRLVLEFFVPEPGLPLALRYSDGGPLHEPEEFRIMPAEITEDYYGELKQKYGATGISAPPAEYLMTGAGHTRKWDSNNSGILFHANDEPLKVPAGYIPHKIFVNAQVFGWFDIFVGFAGREVYSEPHNQNLSGSSVDVTHVITPMIDIAEVDQQGDGLSLTVQFNSDESVAPGSWEGNINVAVLCRRSCRVYEQWQLDTHDRLYAAYRARVAEFEEKRLANPIAGTVGGPASANRQTELETIKKAAIYILKGELIYHDLYPTPVGGIPVETFDIAGLQQLRDELDFFEEAFEWRQATFVLYPSFWGNEDRASERKNFHTADPRHAAFLAAGAARVLLPVLPGREKEVLGYLARRFGPDYADLGTDGTLPSAATIYEEIWTELPEEPNPNQPETWRKSLTESRQDLVLGQGSVAVKGGRKKALLNTTAEHWFDPILDLGRELWIEGRQFFVAKITVATQEFELDKLYSGTDNQNAVYVVGARTVGSPWRVSIPTSLVVLKEFKDQIAVT